jgi:hypothetical protein
MATMEFVFVGSIEKATAAVIPGLAAYSPEFSREV